MTQTDMTVEATLSGSAAKLLLHLLRVGPGPRETPALMRGAGIGDRKAFYAAKAQLAEKGLWENPSWCRESTHPVWGNPPEVREKPTEVSEIPPAVWENPTGTVGVPHIYIGTTDPTSVLLSALDPRRVPAEERNFSGVLEKTSRELCQDADLMPWGGDPKRPTSEFQSRRDAQVKAICRAWGEMFPQQNPLTTARAKELLVATDNVAEDVYDALEASAGKDYPFSYAKKILTSKPKPQTSDGRDHTGEMLDWTPEWEAKVRASEERLRRAGFKFGEDDE